MLLAVKNEIAKPLSLLFNRLIQEMQTVSKALLISAKVIFLFVFYPTQVKYYHKVQLTDG
jgi:hypothetical protein